MKIFIYLILFSVFLNASYQKSKEYYDSGMYQKAISEAQKSYSEYGNEKLHLIWAKSAYKLGYIDEAMSAYERVLILDENNKEASFALLKIYSKTKRDKLAQELIIKLSNTTLSQDELKILKKYKNRSKHTLKLNSLAEIGYDTNVNSSPDSTTFKKEESLFAKLTAGVKYKNELKNNQRYIEGALNIFYQNNFDATLYNMLLINTYLGVGYNFKKLNIFIPIKYSKLNFLNQDLFYKVSINPQISKKFNNYIFTKLSASYSLRKYNSLNSYRDDTMYGIYGLSYLMLNGNYAYLKISFENFSQDSKTAINYYVDKELFLSAIGFNYKTNYKNLIANLEYKYKTTSFKQRDDKLNQIELKISKNINNFFNLYLSNMYAINNSTLSNAEYNKFVISFGITFRR